MAINANLVLRQRTRCVEAHGFARTTREIRLFGQSFSPGLKLVQLRQHTLRIADEEFAVVGVLEQVIEIAHSQLLGEV